MAKIIILESFGATAVMGLGFRAPKVGFIYEYCDRERSTERILFKFSSFIPWDIGRGKFADYFLVKI